MTDTKLITRIFTDERVEKWRERYFWVNTITAVVALASFLLYHGKAFPDSWTPWITVLQALCLILLIGETLGVYIASRTLAEGWRQAPTDTLGLLVGLLMGLGLFLASHWASGVLTEADTFNAFALLTQAGLGAFVTIRLLRFFSILTRLIQSPLLVFTGSFGGLILLGTGLLLLPGAHTPGHEIGFLDAFFTATSATCVTGLVVVDTGAAWTRFGQLVILALIQCGGLGIMTFAAFFGLAFGRGMGVRGAAAVGEMLNLDFVGRVGRLAAWIVGITFSFELLGGLALYGHWVDAAGAPLPTGEQIYYSAFHSISAFCNAGFALYGDSMVRYAGDWPVVLSISGLVIAGGVGFTVIVDLATYRFWANPYFRRIPIIRRKVRHQQLPRLSTQTRIVLIVTLALLLVGTFGFWALEAGNTLKDRGFSEQLAASFFQGMTPRTAGFNSVDYGQLLPVTQFFTMLLMLIGASPGSTGGGLKTTTFVVMLLAVVATLRGRPTEAFKRRIPEALIRKSLVMLFLVLTFTNTALLLLMLTEADGIGSVEQGFEKLAFEVVSAFCTVGLSTGITTELTGLGKLIIIACMYVGRVGPLTLVLAIGSKQPRKFEYPEEQVMIG
ncbi:MAG: Trk family potassium uptake protein [Planctomycetes bacterium]|nr:Trk family potassium uptake protein [Planctomycetota bacterium]